MPPNKPILITLTNPILFLQTTVSNGRITPNHTIRQDLNITNTIDCFRTRYITISIAIHINNYWLLRVSFKDNSKSFWRPVLNPQRRGRKPRITIRRSYIIHSLIRRHRNNHPPLRWRNMETISSLRNSSNNHRGRRLRTGVFRRTPHQQSSSQQRCRQSSLKRYHDSVALGEAEGSGGPQATVSRAAVASDGTALSPGAEFKVNRHNPS